ncbi:2-polyprenyl-6-methoxyphenol hydroxylase-like FAD-dependent oxidoreductase [Lentzea atacamensis]|uniref:2-polyprenyl-6-methoxyphenol hydroxylase-like FAD-dependent oxidoreductase n=1 Tax=Lentzea atacamensis TaxID=531938 RepID=A0A316IJP0_9PSEU|nr:FAD-dependent monooxygenase [Lentzea atacamensis]PWK87419.1 2-polyprenyl-6-methoxyphenol hydroxylase-like FAD-dependent oxidoreductase [Lentzea atacamensis]
MRVLVSGASIAGPVLAYWLTRYGHEVTVVERSPVLRKTGGHAVDLFKPAMDISERMGVLPRIESLATGTERITFLREGTRRPISADATKLFGAASDRHVEIMRDDLSEVYYDATLPDVAYVFGDSITSIGDDGDVTFENAAPRKFDLVIGADGLHSNVRRLVFGEVEKAFVGAYLAVLSVPRELGAPGAMTGHIGPGRSAAVYGARSVDDARAVFLFRTKEELDYHYRDVARQKQLLREAFAGLHPEVDGWLEHLDDDRAFYFDSITQLRGDTWARGRVALVGDAGYCPGPAIGGSTSLAVLGAYVLAGELARTDDHVAAFARYEDEMRGLVHASREFALGAAKALVPSTRAGVWALTRGAQFFTSLPLWLLRPLVKLNSKGMRLHDSMRVPDYERQGAEVSAP